MRLPTLSTLVAGLLILLGPAVFADPPAAKPHPETTTEGPGAPEGIQVPPPPFSEGIFPCTPAMTARA